MSLHCQTFGKGGENTEGTYIYLKVDQPLPEIPVKSEHVAVFYQVEPQGDFELVGLVEAFASGDNLNVEDLFKELQKQAAFMNADAIYDIDPQRFNMQGPAMHAAAKAIRFKE